MSDGAAIRSVRVAVALCDRFAELLRGPNEASVRKGKAMPQLGLVGMLGAVSVSHNQDALSLRLGEAQQIYPEIWRHLDDARSAFAAGGVDVAPFDAVRAAVGNPGLGADVDMAADAEGVTKVARFNEAGLDHARRACTALMAATPQIDWAAIAAAEANDPAALAFGRSRRTKLWLSLGALALLIAAPFIYVQYLRNAERHKYEGPSEPAQPAAAPLSDAERAQLGAKLADLRTHLAAARQAWPAATAPEVLSAIAPGAAPCPFPFAPPTDAAADAFLRDGNPGAPLGSWLVEYRPNQPIPDDQLARAARAVDVLERRLATASRDDLEHLAKLEPVVAFLIVDRWDHATVTATAPKIAYTPGELVGRGYLYSIPDAKIVCAAAIDAKNPTELSQLAPIRRAPEAKELLARELEVEIRRALATSLHATTP